MTVEEILQRQDELFTLACQAADIEERQNLLRRELLEESLRRLAAEPTAHDLPFPTEAQLKELVYTGRPCPNARNVVGDCYTLYGDCLFCERSDADEKK